VINALKFKFGNTEYEHNELDDGNPATRFRNRGNDLHLEARHGNLGPLRGAFGLQFTDFDFSALGAEAFVPSTNTSTQAGFFFEELPLGAVNLTFGGRHERNEVRSDGGGPVPFGAAGPRFDPALTRSFNGNSGALGAVWTFAPGLALAVNGAYTERAPTYYELFANGPHAATGVRAGDAAFGRRSREPST
jgi:iron complex outermembrane receptor protein